MYDYLSIPIDVFLFMGACFTFYYLIEMIIFFFVRSLGLTNDD